MGHIRTVLSLLAETKRSIVFFFRSPRLWPLSSSKPL